MISDKLNDSGYVYDAVWVYALALKQLVLEDATYLQNLHSLRSAEAFVRIIRNIDFDGVSGRINFHNRTSRLSDIDVFQWICKKENESSCQQNKIGVYSPRSVFTYLCLCISSTLKLSDYTFISRIQWSISRILQLFMTSLHYN